MSNRNEIANILLTSKAVALNVENPFTYSSGIRSPIYCDNRLLITDVKTRKKIVDAFCEIVTNLNPKQIAGVATAGIAWGAWIADRLDLPYIYVRSKPKGHGQGKQIEGSFIREDTVMIEDLISTGKSSLEAIEGTKKENVPVTALIAIFTYGLSSGKEAFEKEKLKVQTLTDLDTLLEEAIAYNYLKADMKSEVLRWRTNPETWFKS